MFKAAEVASMLNGRLEGDGETVVSNVCSVTHSRTDAIAIVLSENDLKFVRECTAAILVGPPTMEPSVARARIMVDRLDVQAINRLLRYYKVEKYSLADQENVSTFPDVYIGKHAQIGQGCYFMPGVKIMNGVTIGDNVAINANTVIKEGTVIGDNVTIDSNNSIGNFSFEYMRGPDGGYERVESVGRVIIQDNVEIGCNNCIDRGTLGDTVIGHGTRIDNLVQIGHDCRIGNHCLIVSQTGISGHTRLGNGVVLHGQTGLAGYLEIGDNSVVQAQSGVSRSCPPGSRLFGYPAREAREYLKSLATLNALSSKKSRPKKKDDKTPATVWLATVKIGSAQLIRIIMKQPCSGVKTGI